MGVTITRNGKPQCTTCGGLKKTRQEITSQGKTVVMSLPCYVCSPLNPRLAFLGLVQSTAPAPGKAQGVPPSRTLIENPQDGRGEP